jgi:hypothetical protein
MRFLARRCWETVEKRVYKKACGTPKIIGAVKGCRSEWKLWIVLQAAGPPAPRSSRATIPYYIGQLPGINSGYARFRSALANTSDSSQSFATDVQILRFREFQRRTDQAHSNGNLHAMQVKSANIRA